MSTTAERLEQYLADILAEFPDKNGVVGVYTDTGEFVPVSEVLAELVTEAEELLYLHTEVEVDDDDYDM